MTSAEIQKLLADGLTLIVEGETLLKQTTVGYKNQKPSWYTNTTTNWWKGLDKIRQGKAKISEAKTEVGKLVSPPPEPPPTPNPPPDSGSKGLGLMIYAQIMDDVTEGDLSDFDTSVSAWNDIGDYQYTSMMSVNREWWSGVSHTVADANPSWYMTMPGGGYAIPPDYPSNREANPGNVGYQNEWANQVIAHMNGVQAVTGKRPKGVFVDDVVGTPEGILGGVYPTQYPNASARPAWKAAIIAFFKNVVPKLNAAGYRVIANSNNWLPGDNNSNNGVNDIIWFKELGPWVDGIFREYYLQAAGGNQDPFWDESPVTNWMAYFSNWIQLPLELQKVGCDFYCNFQPKHTDKNGRLLRGGFLLTWDGGPGSMFYWPGTTGPTVGQPYVFPEAMHYLGLPTAAAVRVGMGWKRTFTHGKLLLNATLSPMVIDGITVPAQDAVYIASEGAPSEPIDEVDTYEGVTLYVDVHS